MATRYIVQDVERESSFYVEKLGFDLLERWGPAFAIVRRGDVVLWLAGPSSSAGRAMTDGRIPEPGGWNRIVIEVEDFDALVEMLRADAVTFRNEPLSGPGGTQVLIEDPSGNPIELFSPHQS
ncbi:MAG: VOC family protein [Fimbriimonadaceae bacterium]|nr:VOC family protein [Fimbriimonadaceae bacterium]